ncbi:MAG: MMPL family transporter [Nitrospinota bacterium]
MSKIRNRIENKFELFGRLVFRNRFKALFIMFLFIGALVSQLPKITIDTSTEGFLHDNDPILIAYNEFRDQFGRDEILIIAIQPPDVFDRGFLQKLKNFHQDLENETPYVDDITSLVNARNTRGEKDELIVEDLLENFPKTEDELKKLKERVLSNKNYRNFLISEDGRFTTVAIKTDAYSSEGAAVDVMEGFEEEGEPAKDAAPREFLTDKENSEVVNAVKKVIARYEAPDFRIFAAGSPVVTNDLKRNMMNDMRRFIKLTILIIGVVLAVVFRRITGVIFPLFIVLASLLSTVSLMAIFGVSIKLPTQILPSFIMAVGVADAVHLLVIFYRRYTHTGDKEGSIAFALGHSGLAIFMTSLTTAAGLFSFALADLAPIADLGHFASAGVMLAFIYTIVLLPALLAIVPIKRKEAAAHHQGGGGEVKGTFMDRVLIGIADFSTGHPKAIVAVSAVLIFIGLALASQLRLSHNPLIWFPEKHPIRQATEKIDRELKGSITLEVIVDTKKENGLHDPALLKKLDALSAEIGKYDDGEIFVGKTFSISDILKEINKALNENREEFYSIPDNRKLIAQELLLFENSGSDDLEDVVDSRFSKGRFTIKTPWRDAILYGDFVKYIEGKFKKTIGNDADIAVTGMVSLLFRTISATVVTTAKSYGFAFVVITFLMILLLGSVKYGLLSMIPNLMPIIMAMGLIKATGIPMDMFTMLIGSIAIGLAVDDTVHFMHNFRRYHHHTGDVREATRRTLLTAGRAMLTTTIVLSLGFFVFMFASMNNIFNFGLITGFTIITALLADFFLAPALMTIFEPKETEMTDDEKPEDGVETEISEWK